MLFDIFHSFPEIDKKESWNKSDFLKSILCLISRSKIMFKSFPEFIMCSYFFISTIRITFGRSIHFNYLFLRLTNCKCSSILTVKLIFLNDQYIILVNFGGFTSFYGAFLLDVGILVVDVDQSFVAFPAGVFIRS